MKWNILCLSLKALAPSGRSAIFKKHCGQFLDCFHVHNQGIIYSKVHSISNFGQGEKETVIVVQ